MQRLLRALHSMYSNRLLRLHERRQGKNRVSASSDGKLSRVLRGGLRRYTESESHGSD